MPLIGLIPISLSLLKCVFVNLSKFNLKHIHACVETNSTASASELQF